MKIVVCIKQVPDVDDIKWTKENNLDRSQMLTKLNTQDEWALNWALQIKKRYQEANLTVISMGPNQAKEILQYALAKGANRAILLSDKFFSGSDTYATSLILSKAIEQLVPDFSCIITGQKADDGDTEQVPVSLAQNLDIIDVTNVIEIHNADKNMAIVSQKLDNEINMFEVKTPCLLAIKAPCKENHTPKIDDYVKSQSIPIETFGLEDLKFDKTQVGIMGSPTVVNKAYRPEISKNTVEITQDIPKTVLNILFKVQK